MTRSDPAISIVVASHQRRDLLRRCLRSLAEQSADPAAFEVIVVDDGSTDGTAEMAEALDVPYRCQVRRQPNEGQARALNAGIEAAAGGACLIMDDDLIASPQLVAAHVEAQAGERPVLAIGALRQRPVEDPGDWYAHAFAASWSEREAELSRRTVHWSDCYGANFSAPTHVLRELEGFDPELPVAYDLELAFRLVQAGCNPVYLPQALALHDDQKSGATIARDQRRYGAICPRLVRRHPGMSSRTIEWFHDSTPREIALRRALLSVRVPLGVLVAGGRMLPGRAKATWFGFVSRYAFWLGVREAVGRGEWSEMTGDRDGER